MHSLNHKNDCRSYYTTLTIFCSVLEKTYNIATLLQCTLKSQPYIVAHITL